MNLPSKQKMGEEYKALLRKIIAEGVASPEEIRLAREAYKLKLKLWLFFCTWTEILLLSTAYWLWSWYRSGFRWTWSSTTIMLLVWFFCGLCYLLRWAYELDYINKHKSTIQKSSFVESQSDTEHDPLLRFYERRRHTHP